MRHVVEFNLQLQHDNASLAYSLYVITGFALLAEKL